MKQIRTSIEELVTFLTCPYAAYRARTHRYAPIRKQSIYCMMAQSAFKHYLSRRLSLPVVNHSTMMITRFNKLIDDEGLEDSQAYLMKGDFALFSQLLAEKFSSYSIKDIDVKIDYVVESDPRMIVSVDVLAVLSDKQVVICNPFDQPWTKYYEHTLPTYIAAKAVQTLPGFSRLSDLIILDFNSHAIRSLDLRKADGRQWDRRLVEVAKSLADDVRWPTCSLTVCRQCLHRGACSYGTGL